MLFDTKKHPLITQLEIDEYFSNEISELDLQLSNLVRSQDHLIEQRRVVRSRLPFYQRWSKTVKNQTELDICLRLSRVERDIAILRDALHTAHKNRMSFYKREQAALDHYNDYQQLRYQIRAFANEKGHDEYAL